MKEVGVTDYYHLLEVPSTATQSEIKRAYRRLARKYHPDLNKQALDRHMKQLNEAYKVLSNPVERAAYDRQRHEEEQRQAIQEALRRQQAEQALQRKRAAEKMTWVEGIFGFVRELKRELREK